MFDAFLRVLIINSRIRPAYIRSTDFISNTRSLILSLYNGGFVAHNILRTGSQDMDLKVQCKSLYVNAASKSYVYRTRVDFAVNLRSGWFPLFHLHIWFC
jgi:hypothetical protein